MGDSWADERVRRRREPMFGKPLHDDRKGYIPSFKARLNGKCTECEGPIRVGETIAKTSFGYAHLRCLLK